MKAVKLAIVAILVFVMANFAYASESCNENTESSCIDWNDGIVYAVGMGVPNPKFKSRAQQNFSAQKAAETVAKRNLLQMVEELHVTSSTTVKDGMLESDNIQTTITGVLRQVRKVGKTKAMADGSVSVTVAMHMKEILPALLGEQAYGNFLPPAVKADPEVKVDAAETDKTEDAVKADNGIYTGLIVDARGLNVVPALSPRLISEDGKEVYGSAYVDRDFAVQMGMAGYAKATEEALENDRVTGNPLEIKAVKKASDGVSDIVLSNEDAQLLQSIYKTQTFLREARVMILVD